MASQRDASPQAPRSVPQEQGSMGVFVRQPAPQPVAQPTIVAGASYASPVKETEHTQSSLAKQMADERKQFMSKTPDMRTQLISLKV